MQEYVYSSEDDEPMTFTMDEDKLNELVETVFQFLRESGISVSDDVQGSQSNEAESLELVEKIVDLLEITNAIEE